MTRKIRHDACYAVLSAEEKLQILRESEQRDFSLEARLEKLENLLGKRPSPATYYRMLTRIREIKPYLIAEVEACKAQPPQAVVDAGMPALTEIRAKLGAISKRLDMIDRRQSFMDSQLHSISAGRRDAFFMYMNMRNLNRAIRNSSFVADALEVTRDIPYPGKRKETLDRIFSHLKRLEKDTEKRVDDFLLNGLSKAFDKGDLTPTELFMLRLRLLCGCSVIDRLERDSQTPMSEEEEKTGLLFQSELDPRILFVDFWKDVRDGWLCDSAAQIYRFGKLPTPYETTVAQTKRILAYSRIKPK